MVKDLFMTWIGLAIITAAMAEKKNRSFGTWFLVGLIPYFGFILVNLVPQRPLLVHVEAK